MPITIFEDYLICSILGFSFGVIGSWLYVKNRIHRHTISDVIETAFIEKNVIELELLSSYLNELVMRIKDCGEEFKTHLILARDIEFDLAALVELEKIEDLDALLDMDSLEKNK